MTIEVKLYATLTRYAPGGTSAPFPLDMPEGATVGDVLHALGIPGDIPLVVLAGDSRRQSEDRLNPRDSLRVFPPIAGG